MGGMAPSVRLAPTTCVIHALSCPTASLLLTQQSSSVSHPLTAYLTASRGPISCLFLFATQRLKKRPIVCACAMSSASLDLSLLAFLMLSGTMSGFLQKTHTVRKVSNSTMLGTPVPLSRRILTLTKCLKRPQTFLTCSMLTLLDKESRDDSFLIVESTEALPSLFILLRKALPPSAKSSVGIPPSLFILLSRSIVLTSPMISLSWHLSSSP
mmetsp:Transcript_47460/g.115331  ORF Transcript_47460/g.115331 Transcript_47460/m.115331 type:complete len:212 (-) Transcript_47460:518-1153(-)